MADLSEKLGLEPAEEDAVCSPAALEADRREVVGAVARWLERLCPGCRCPHADDIRRELLAPPSPGEGREPVETWLLECPWPECRHRWESRFASLHYKSCPGCHNSLTFNSARVIQSPSEPEGSDGE